MLPLPTPDLIASIVKNFFYRAREIGSPRVYTVVVKNDEFKKSLFNVSNDCKVGCLEDLMEKEMPRRVNKPEKIFAFGQKLWGKDRNKALERAYPIELQTIHVSSTAGSTREELRQTTS